MVVMKTAIIVILTTLCLACASQPSVYQRLGGTPIITQIADNFIEQISYDETIFTYFAESDAQRFRDKFIEHLCVHTGGPCTYTGDDMVRVHQGMNITEADFNRVVQLLVNAMEKAGVPFPLQNEVLAVLAPMRSEIIYL